MNTNTISKLRESIFPLYKDLLLSNNYKDVCTFAVQWGENFPQQNNTGLLFVGKAVNGWVTKNTDVEFLFDKNNSERIFARSDQMEWIDNLAGNSDSYNSNKSAFLRLLNRVTSVHYSHQWYSHIAWTNLYKIAPWEGGNPNSLLKKQQFEYCSKILKVEIEVLSPKYVIMLTSGWESEFIEEFKKGKDFKEISEVRWDKYKSSLVEIDNVKYIISHHPQGKSEIEHKNAILKLML